MGRDGLHNAHYQLHARGSPQVPLPLPSPPSASSSASVDDPFFAVDRALEMDLLEASGQRTEDDAMLARASEQRPFSSSTLQPFHALSERAVDATMALCRVRSATHKQLAAVRCNRAGLEAEWKLVREHADVRVFRGVRRRAETKTTSMLATGMLHGTLAETMDGLYAETTKEARVLYALLSDTFMDASVLHVDSYRTAQHPHQFAGVTWMALETPRGYGVCKDRDFLCFKKMGTFKDPETGEDVGFLTLQSLDPQEIEAVSTPAYLPRSAVSVYASAVASADLVRGFLSLTAFFQPCANGSLSLFLHADFNARGHLASRLSDLLFADLVVALANAPRTGQAKSLAMLLQSMSAGQLPPGGVAAASSASYHHHLLPLLSEKNRDRCTVCAKTLWKMLERPEFCRSCWARTCRRCRVTLPIYCADYHRAHEDDGGTLLRRRRLPRPCKETFCLACVCSVLPHGVQMHARLLQRTAKKKRLQRSKNKTNKGSITNSAVLRRGGGGVGVGVGGGGGGGVGVAPSVAFSAGSNSHRTRSRGGGGGRGGGVRSTGSQASGGSKNGSTNRQRGQVYVQLPSRHNRGLTTTRGRATTAMASNFDDHLSISVLSSVESEKLQRQRLSLTGKPTVQLQQLASNQHQKSASKHEIPGLPKPTSMLQVLENFQLSHMTTTSSMDLLDQFPPLDDDHDHEDHHQLLERIRSPPLDPPSSSSPSSSHRRPPLQLRVNVSPPRRHRASKRFSIGSSASSASSATSSHARVYGTSSPPSTTSRRTNAASSYKQSPTAKPKAFDDEYYRRALQRYLDKRRTSVGVASTSTNHEEDEEDDWERSRRRTTALSPLPPLHKPVARRASTGTHAQSFHVDSPPAPPSTSSFSSRSSASVDFIANKYRRSGGGSGTDDAWAPPAY